MTSGFRFQLVQLPATAELVDSRPQNVLPVSGQQYFGGRRGDRGDEDAEPMHRGPKPATRMVGGKV